MKATVTALMTTIGLVVMSVPTLAVDPVPYESATTILADDGTEIHCVFDVTLDEDGSVTGLEFTDCPEPATLPSEGDFIVPAIVGLTEADAVAALEAAALVADISELIDPNVPAGTVIAQEPPPGTGVAPGDTVALVVSTGDGNSTAVVPAQDYSDLRAGDSFVNYDAFGGGQTTITLVRVESGIKTSPYSKPDPGITTLALLFTFAAGPDGGRTNLVNAYSPNGTEYDAFYGAEGKYAQGWDYAEVRPDKTVQGWKVFEVPKKGNVEVVMSGYDAYGDEVFATWVVKP